jgi:drug/metabolite transporter (DMT)-like permease
MARPMNNLLLYLLTIVIWGSTWIGIKYQLGVVSPLVSVAHRSLLSALLIFAFLLLRRVGARLSRRDHGFILVQGLCLFCINYLFIYTGTADLTSGLVAVVFSTMVILNPLFGALFLRTPLSPMVLVGGAVGLLGMMLVFSRELEVPALSDLSFRALLLCFCGTCFASLGNIVAARNHLAGLPVLVCNAWGMAYGALALYAAALLTGTPITVDWRAPYLLSLGYLVLFGSVIAFWAYVTLIGNLGVDRAAYTTLLFPLVALLISTLAEQYHWSPPVFAGIALILAGNWLVMRRASRPAGQRSAA